MEGADAENKPAGQGGIKILVCYHKRDRLFKNNILAPIHAGRAAAREEAGRDPRKALEFEWLAARMPGDDTGDNISLLNPKFNEMTAIYWAWKNYEKVLGNPAYFGLAHYRRYLDFFNGPDCNENAKPNLHAAIKEEVIQREVYASDLCVNKRIISEHSVTAQYALNHNIKDLELAYALLKSMYPGYSEALEHYSEHNEHFICNLFVMKKDLFMHYAEWMFSLLLAMEKMIDYAGYDAYQSRAPSFLSERLTGVYFTEILLSGRAKLAEYRYLITVPGISAKRG